MYYTEEEIETAINKASKILAEKSAKVSKFTYGYNDCFSFLVEYDKALRGTENTKLHQFSSKFKDYKDVKSWLNNMTNNGFYNEKELAVHVGYKPKKEKKPSLGDIACQIMKENVGLFMVAGKTHWCSTCPENNGIYNTRRVSFYEPDLIFLATPIRS